MSPCRVTKFLRHNSILETLDISNLDAAHGVSSILLVKTPKKSIKQLVKPCEI